MHNPFREARVAFSSSPVGDPERRVLLPLSSVSSDSVQSTRESRASHLLRVLATHDAHDMRLRVRSAPCRPLRSALEEQN